MIHKATGYWMPVFGLAVGMDVLTGMLALFALKPPRRRFMMRAQRQALAHSARGPAVASLQS